MMVFHEMVSGFAIASKRDRAVGIELFWVWPEMRAL